MYKLHLIFKYLRKRRIAWVSLVAVTLCTAMVLIVISVMGGWLRMFRQLNHALIGDVIVSRLQSMDGFGHYQEMIDEIKCLPEVKDVSPEISTFGLAAIGDARRTNVVRTGVMVIGLDIKSAANVTGFADGLYLTPKRLAAMAEEHDQKAAKEEADLAALQAKGNGGDSFLQDDVSALQAGARRDRADAQALRAKAADFPSFDKAASAETLRDFSSPAKSAGHIDEAARPGLIVGSGVVRLEDVRPSWLYTMPVTLTILKANSGGELSDQRAIDRYWIVDDSHTGLWQIDQNNVYVPFAKLQHDLQMDAYTYTDADTGATMTAPAKCNQLEIALKSGCDPNLAKPKIDAIVQRIARKYDMIYDLYPVVTQTWEESRADTLSAVEHEKVLLVVLFAIISVVAVFLIFCIFYMVVVEKTRDIGIIKSVGATGAGVAGIFLGYGLTIGILGGGMGLLLGYLVVHNINPLHTELSKFLGAPIWSAKTYVFDTIPNTMETRSIVVIVGVAIISSVLGAVIPAIRAARMNPVEALRWE